MNANLDSISPLISDLKTKPDNTPKADSKRNDSQSFKTVLNKAEEKRAVKAPAKESPKEISQNAEESAPLPKPLKATGNDEKIEKPAAKSPSEKNAIDDKAGVVGESFDHMAVSYPVSQIAKESLDEKTVTNLKDQGLWEIPSMVMAQPSPLASQQLALMKDAISELGEAGVGTEDVLPIAKPLAQFMASLESELGVKPDRLIKAFEKLSPDQLQATPKETVALVVKSLGLNPKDEAKATELFTKLLSEMENTRNQGMNPTLMALAGGATLNATPVDKATEKAVVKGRTQVATAKYVQNGPAEKSLGTDSTVQKDAIKDSFGKEPSLSNDVVASKPEKGLKENGQQQMNLKDARTEAPQQQAALPSAFAVPQNQVETPANTLTQASHAAQPDTFNANSMAAQSHSVDEKEVKDLGKTFKDTKVSAKSVTASPSSSTQVAANDFAPAKTEIPGQAVAPSGVAAGELKAGEDTKHEAIRSIVNQAQMLAQKGGGEIRMSLKPDHLGEIQLKVAMEGNRVNVQMTTERGEVKKMLEQSVHELRHGLASHNLSMDKLDVSVGNRDTQNFLKGQPDFGAARDFANQFAQQQNNRREFMNDLSSLRGGAQKSIMGMDRQAQAQRVMSTRGSSSGRLNVVA